MNYRIPLILCVLFFGTFNQLKAQGTFYSENNLFFVDYLKGCAGTEITISNNQGAGVYFYCFDAEGVPNGDACYQSIVDQPSFTYDQPGTYLIKGFKQPPTGQQRVYDSLYIEILEPEAPLLSIANCNDQIVIDLDASLESFDNYTIDYGDGSAVINYDLTDFPVSYTYADNSISYDLSITGDFDSTGNNSCGFDQTNTTATIVPNQVTQGEGIINTLAATSENAFSIEYNATPNQLFNLEIATNNGAFVTVNSFTGEGDASYSFTGLDLTDNYYCVRLVNTSPCDGSTLNSNTVCTIQLTGEAAADGNRLNWNANGFESFELSRNGSVISTGTPPYTDNAILCGQEDTYRVVALDTNGISVSSLPVTIVARNQGDPASILNISTEIISDTALRLEWEVPAGIAPERFFIYKRRGGEEDDFFLLDTTQNVSYTDVGYAFLDRTYTYAVTYSNACGGTAPIEINAQNMLLTIDSDEQNALLGWTPFTGFTDGVTEYVIEKYDSDLNVIESITVNAETSYTDMLGDSEEQLLNYRVFAYSNTSLISVSNMVSYKIPAIVKIPSAFSPNGDGLNETLLVRGKFIDRIDVKIFNRWGNLIFQSSDLSVGWDGSLSDRDAPTGAYTYSITVVDPLGEEYQKTGIINLIR